MKNLVYLGAILCLLCPDEAGIAADLKFERIVIDGDFPDAYQVEVADVNGDKKPDIVALGGSTCAWYENPSWKKRIITGPKQTPGIITSATTDLDGDGKAEVAIGYEFEMDKPKRGKFLLMRQGASIDDPWTKEEPIDDTPSTTESIHRIRWGMAKGVGKVLVVAPLFGGKSKPPTYSDPARIHIYYPRGWGYSTHAIQNSRPVLHSIEVRDVDGDGNDEILTADNLGVTLIFPGPIWSFKHLIDGAPGEAPKRGVSEVHLGALSDGRRFLTTVEPWHGTQVAIYLEEAPKNPQIWASQRDR